MSKIVTDCSKTTPVKSVGTPSSSVASPMRTRASLREEDIRLEQEEKEYRAKQMAREKLEQNETYYSPLRALEIELYQRMFQCVYICSGLANNEEARKSLDYKVEREIEQQRKD